MLQALTVIVIATVLATNAVAAPGPAQPFDAVAFDGRRVTLESLRGNRRGSDVLFDRLSSLSASLGPDRPHLSRIKGIWIPDGRFVPQPNGRCGFA